MDASKLETVYGLLWSMPIDTTTLNGRAASLARNLLLEEIDKDGQARGIEAARVLLGVLPSEALTKAARDMNAKAAFAPKSRWA